jgi:hypothetical protein
MDTVVVTLRQHDHEVDLELPVAVPLFVLAPILAEKLGWADMPTSLEGTRYVTAHVISSKTVVRPTETLGQAGVVDGDILELSVARQPLPVENNFSQGKGTYLQCRRTGEIFSCRGRATIIGRLPNHPISLRNLPGNDAVSRTHANLLRRDDGYWLKDERSTNGTVVDGYMLKPGETVRLRQGSLVQFGVDGPVLVFHRG